MIALMMMEVIAIYIDTDRFIIDDETAFNTKIAEYFNSDTQTIEEKLQLARVMQMQQSGLDFDIDTVVASVDNDITQSLVRDTFNQKDILVGTVEDEILQTDAAKSKILLNEGDDKLISGKGHNTFYFRRGDGSDTISDAGGLDKLVFDEGINRDDVTQTVTSIKYNPKTMKYILNYENKIKCVNNFTIGRREVV